MIDLDEKSLWTVKTILRDRVPDCKVIAFGSRVTGTAEKFSDLDLALVSESTMDWRRIESIKDAFSESDLPIMVDVLDWNTLSESFRAIITERSEVLQDADEAVSRQ